MRRTGHCSIAVRSYKTASYTMAKAILDAFQPPSGEPECKVKEGDKQEEVEASTGSSPSLLLVIKHGDTSLSFNFT